jgi:hypothetical protein
VNSIRILLVLVVLVLLFLRRPKGMIRQARRLWARRDYMLGVIVFGVLVYLVIGVYRMYEKGWFDAWIL